MADSKFMNTKLLPFWFSNRAQLINVIDQICIVDLALQKHLSRGEELENVHVCLVLGFSV